MNGRRRRGSTSLSYRFIARTPQRARSTLLGSRERARAPFRRLLVHTAAKHNRAEYGDVPASFNLNVNLSAAHLEAMRQLNTRRVARSLASGDMVEDAEIVSNE